jgi:hypothetical protein
VLEVNSIDGRVDARTPDMTDIDPVPPAALAQAQRRAALHTTVG